MLLKFLSFPLYHFLSVCVFLTFYALYSAQVLLGRQSTDGRLALQQYENIYVDGNSSEI